MGEDDDGSRGTVGICLYIGFSTPVTCCGTVEVEIATSEEVALAKAEGGGGIAHK